MNLYSLKVQTLVARWKHFRSSSSAIFVDDHSYATGAVLRVRTQEEARAVIRAGKFLSTRPTARIWHLRTFVSSPTRKYIFVRSDSNHMLMSSVRCKHGCTVRIPPSVDRGLRNGFPA